MTSSPHAPAFSVKEFTALVSTAFQVDDEPFLADSLIAFSQTPPKRKQDERDILSPQSDTKVESLPSFPKSAGMDAAPIPVISVSPPESQLRSDLFTPSVPLVMRHERAMKARRASFDSSASIFSRGRGSCYVPSFLYSPSSDCIPASSPCPSSYAPSRMTSSAEVITQSHSAPSSQIKFIPSLIPRPKTDENTPSSPRPSSKDWTLSLESPAAYFRRRRQQSTKSPNSGLLTSPHNTNTTNLVVSSPPSNSHPTALSRRLAAASDSPPPSPLYSDSSTSDDSIGPSSGMAPTFTFSSHPYSNPYFASRSLSSLTDVPPHDLPLDNKPSRRNKSTSKKNVRSSRVKCGSTSSSSSTQSGWWLDDDWIMCDADEDDDMLYYTANSSFTSFLSFS